MSERLDAIIVGTGQAGKPLAGALAEAGWKTAIIERDRVGGTCVVRGCTPTKTMVASARVAHLARRAAEYGVNTGPIEVDMRQVRERKRAIVDSWSAGSEKGMRRHDSLELILGEAHFSGPHEVTVQVRDGGERVLTADHVFLNTGARPATPSLRGLNEVEALDSTSIMELSRVPDHLVVLGGGFVGLEFAQMFRRFGARVSIVEQRPHLASHEDEDVCRELTSILKEDGIRIFTDTSAASVSRRNGGGVSLRIDGPDRSEVLDGSHLLVAVGRTPNTDALRLEAAGVEVDDRGYVRVDERLRTTAEGIWALGDVAGSPPFTHVAYDDYRVVRANLLDGGDRTTLGRIATYTLFTDPELGRVGLSEREARQEGHDVRIARLPMKRVARAMEVDETRGLMKAVVDRDTDRILGAAVLGIQGGEIAAVLQTAMWGDLPYTVLQEGVISHPTLAESLNNLFAALED